MSDKESDPKNQEATDKANTVHKFKEAFNAAVFGPNSPEGQNVPQPFTSLKYLRRNSTWRFQTLLDATGSMLALPDSR